MATSTTSTIKGSIQTRNNPDAVNGASSTDSVILVPFLEMSDNSITPKENDWIVDGSDTWLITGIKEDPINAIYVFSVRLL